MVKTVHVPNYHEDVVYNTKDIDEWQFDKTAVIGQGYRSGSMYMLIFNPDGTLDTENTFLI